MNKFMRPVRAAVLVVATVGSVTLSAGYQQSPCFTTIMTDRDGAKVVVNGEYVGDSPAKVDMTAFDASYFDGDGKRCIAQTRLTIKAYPPSGSEGCVAVEVIRENAKPPNRMYLDTGMCPIMSNDASQSY